MTQPSPKASASAIATADRSAGQAGRRIWIALLAAAVLLVGSLQLSRAGYSPDEEFTVFAVKGIAADGLPLLPSGLLYDRGLVYSYASWLAGVVAGSELPAYRALSLLSAIAALAIVFALVRRVSSPAAGLVASLLVAASMPFWAAATTARFYAPFVASYLAVLWCLTGTSSRLGGLVALAAICRWTHELAFTLAVVPIALAIFGSKSDRARWLKATMGIVGGLLLAQAGLFVLHYLAPSSGETMVRRFFLWQVVNLFEVPPDRQSGIVLVVMVVAWLLAPRRAWVSSVVALSGVAMMVAFAIARASNNAPMSRELAAAVLAEGARYPLDMFWHIARATPVTMVMALGMLAARLAGAGPFDSKTTREARAVSSLRASGEWRAPERAMHLLWIGWVLWFGVIESGITINYLLVPQSLMLSAIAVDLVAIVKGSDPEQEVPRGLHPTTQSPRGGGPGLTPARRAVRRGLTPTPAAVVVMLVVAGVAADQWRGDGSIADRLAAARPTIVAPGIADIRDGLQPTDRVACTDELGCLMLLDRVDTWLALDDYVRERFLVKRGDEDFAGVYSGAPAVFRPADLFSPRPDGPLPDRTLIVDIFKEYPTGNSRTWLPRAIEADGLEVRALLETPQLRVLQVSPPVSHAAQQP